MEEVEVEPQARNSHGSLLPISGRKSIALFIHCNFSKAHRRLTEWVEGVFIIQEIQFH